MFFAVNTSASFVALFYTTWRILDFIALVEGKFRYCTKEGANFFHLIFNKGSLPLDQRDAKTAVEYVPLA